MRTRNFSEIRKNIRDVALTLFFSTLGLIIYMVLKMAKLPDLVCAIIGFAVAAAATFLLFPKALGIPFGKIVVSEWARRLGLSPPPGAWKHIVLGMSLAACTLSGMLAASILTGRYEFNLGTASPSHLVFSLIPGIFEEIFFRGVMMFILLRVFRSLEKALVVQIVIFGLAHIKGVDIIAFVEVLSVTIFAISCTYVVYKTRSLMAAIVFHYLHDALLLLVQVPGGDYTGFWENALFYTGLWSMIGVSLLVTKVATDVLQVRAKEPLYERAQP
jgi:membrane protease YdiL (CAAX protease family)